MKAEEFLHSTGPGQVFNPTKQDKISEMRKGYRGEIYVLSEWKSACEVPWNYNELEKTRIYLRASGDISRNVRNPTTTQPKEGGGGDDGPFKVRLRLQFSTNVEI